MKITTVGLDVAKTFFQIHGVDRQGRVVVRKQLKRGQVLGYFANLPPCLIGLEACGSAHYWARRLGEYGHRVKLIAPQFVKPYVKSNKNDAADAEAIREAVARPYMRFVPVKSTAQQEVLALHRARQGFVKARTAQANQIRGLLAEYGIVIPQGISHIAKRLPAILEDDENGLPGLFRALLHRLREHMHPLEEHVVALEKQIQAWHRDNTLSRRLAQIPGIGPITASALSASIGDGKHFKSGRQLAAWLGLVPRQHSSGGKPLLLGISKRGDTYLRTLLIHGARAVIRVARHQTDDEDGWVARLINRRNKNVAAVALANKNARIVWALLAHDKDYQSGYLPTAHSRVAEC
jgi:transposase